MRAIKRMLLLCLTLGMLIASGCGDTALNSNLGSPDLLTENLEKETTYRLHIAEPQTVCRELEMSANPAYFLQKSVRTNAEYQIVDLRVERNKEVKKGDVIAVLQGLGSQMDIEQKQLERDAYAAGIAEMEAYYESLLETAKNLPANTESETTIRSLKITYAQAELDLYKLQSAQSLNAMDDAITSLEAAAGETYIYAPVDGLVRTVTKYGDGDMIPAGTELCVINEAGSQRIYGLSSSGEYVYGREVEVILGRSDSKKTYKGRIVSSPEVQGSEYYSTDIYISIDEKISSRSTDGRATLSYTVLENVIAVPSNAITVQDGRATVQILEGDSVRTRSIVRGPAVGNTITVLQGLNVGDQIVVSSYNS